MDSYVSIRSNKMPLNSSMSIWLYMFIIGFFDESFIDFEKDRAFS